MMKEILPIAKDLVLIGGGHANIQVLKSFYMRPIEGIRVTLVSDQIYAPYSGMLPGHLAGWYDFDETHFDLLNICQQTGVRFILGEVTGINHQDHKIAFRDRPALSYDVASINVGSRPSTQSFEVTNRPERVIALKPIYLFLEKWNQLLKKIRRATNKVRVVTVGGGAGGLEVTLVLHKLLTEAQVDFELTVIQYDPQVLPGHNHRVQKTFEEILKQKSVNFFTNSKAKSFNGSSVEIEGRMPIPADYVLLATQASAPSWFKTCQLPVDGAGFLSTDEFLRVQGVEGLFGAGDCIHFNDQSLPKSGVYAVRQGKVLAQNIRAQLGVANLRKYQPQDKTLALITTGEKNVVGSRGALALRGDWLWKWKDHIDRQFMHRFQNYPPMAESGRRDQLPDYNVEEVKTCGGCGSKVAADALYRSLHEFPVAKNPAVCIGLNEKDDAAVLNYECNKLVVESVDFFRTFYSDSYLFARIASEHALNDIYAMGASPKAAMALVSLPNWLGSKKQDEFIQLLKGSSQVLAKDGVDLVGGHTIEGQELTFGLSVSGTIIESQLMRKSSLRPGQCLIITKALGTGVIMAGLMEGVARGFAVEAALSSMLKGHAEALPILHKYSVQACTDVSGFGLGGHLWEMLSASDVSARLNMRLPEINGASELFAEGFKSSIHLDNLHRINGLTGPMDETTMTLLADAQTSGGLLFSVGSNSVKGCLADLMAAGYPEAQQIGTVVGRQESDFRISVS